MSSTTGHEQAGGEATEVAQEPEPRPVTIELPLVGTQVRVPQLPRIPGQDAVTEAVGSAAAGVATAARGVAGGVADATRGTRGFLPSAPVLFYAGLAATAAFGAISWPVAVAIGVGTAVARGTVGRTAREADAPEA